MSKINNRLMYGNDDRVESKDEWEGVFNSMQSAMCATDIIRDEFGFVGFNIEFQVRLIMGGFLLSFKAPNDKHDNFLRDVMHLGKKLVKKEF